MLQRRHEKVIYENDRGGRVEIAYSFPFFLQQIIGADGTDANVTSAKGVGQDGMTITNVNLQERPLQILGKIKENDKSILAKRRAKLLQVFNPKVQGWLQYEYGDVIRRIRCQVESAPFFSKAFNTFEVLNFVIDLIAPNPYFMDLQEDKEEIALWVSDWEFPFEIPEEGMEFGHRASTLIKNIINTGDAECGMRIEFRALSTVKNPSIFDYDTRKFIKVKRDLVAGDKLVINTTFGNKRVELVKANGEVEDVFHYIDLESEFIQLEPGDNLIQYDAEQGIDSLEVTIYHRPLYVGM